ncbi:MAG TPA: universal stress protein [Bacteroidales bacterium]|nr:universal stress protein [Bacteroidales bacterium]
MKQIVVAIDFSKHSIHALEMAITIANAVDAHIMMVWVDKPDSDDSIFNNADHEHRQEAKERLEELIEKYSPHLKKCKLSYKLRKGKIYKEIANQAKYNDAYLIIAGSHGVSGFEAFWIGSNATKIVTYSPCPVITLRESFPLKKNIQKIVLPIDNSTSTRQKVPFAMEFAKCFNSEIHVLELQSSSLKAVRNKVTSYANQVSSFLDENNVKHEVKTIDAENITTATIKYAEEIKADLIIIMTEQELEISNIWLGPYAQQMVNNSPIPVMSVHPKELDYLSK